MEIKSIDDLCLSKRVYNVFRINNITLEDLLADKYTLHNLYCLPYLGKKSIKEIKESFLSFGYRFKDGQKFSKKLNYITTERINMKNITSSDLWCWSSDMDNIQDLLLDIINDRTTVDQAREMIEVNLIRQTKEKE
jgi:hypothetical protein